MMEPVLHFTQPGERGSKTGLFGEGVQETTRGGKKKKEKKK